MLGVKVIYLKAELEDIHVGENFVTLVGNRVTTVDVGGWFIGMAHDARMSSCRGLLRNETSVLFQFM
jgi:hypothetical protein